MEEQIWYAAYGSNVMYQRFMSYITGDQAAGASFVHRGSLDKTPPVANHLVEMPYELYFAMKSKVWSGGGGAGFLCQTPGSGRVFVRCYLISKRQLADVFRQENEAAGHHVDVGLETMDLSTPGIRPVSPSWYGSVLTFDVVGDIPRVTFTAPWERSSVVITKPPVSYLQIIASGLSESGLDTATIVNYFAETAGSNFYDMESLYELVLGAEAVHLKIEKGKNI